MSASSFGATAEVEVVGSLGWASVEIASVAVSPDPLTAMSAAIEKS